MAALRAPQTGIMVGGEQMNGSIEIRAERPGDAGSIGTVNRFVFGQEDEARLVEAIRAWPGFDPALSLVAVAAGRIVGHILFSPISIVDGSISTPALALAPMAVLPEWQRKGVGSKLVRIGLDVCRSRGHGIVIVVGHPEFYPRFGFVPAGAAGLILPFDAPADAFLVAELIPESLSEVRGEVVYSKPFQPDAT